ncbi:hypothetical protein T484DRAFT_1815470 [Baffinella frigidus]|nr:hypothetical protein T484DRAFT_1815470 [Cryptophyta sp. CCMP2293]
MLQQRCRRGVGGLLFSALFSGIIPLSSQFLLRGAPSLGAPTARWGRVAPLCLRGGAGRPSHGRTVKDLQESCKEKGLRVSGTKAELLVRLGLEPDPVTRRGKRSPGQEQLEGEVAELRRKLSLAEAKLGAGKLGASSGVGCELSDELSPKGPGEEEEEQVPSKKGKRRRVKRAGPTRELEEQLWGEGLEEVAGVDEVGRGPLAGPVLAAAVVLPRWPKGEEPE